MKKKADIYMINSMSNGGAERVVANMANESALKKQVFIITLFKADFSYYLNEKIEIKALLNDKPVGIMRILIIPLLCLKLNLLLNDIFRNYDISLFTCHLRYMQFLCSLTKYKKKAIYVLHESLFIHEKKIWFKIHLDLLYKNRCLVAVSKGVESEIVEQYKVKVQSISTIYNAIDYNNLRKLSLEKNTENSSISKYILFCGRLEIIKNPLELIEAYYKGEFYDQYDLYFIGTGSLLNDLKQLCIKYNIEKNVKFLGWQRNPYVYMRNASLLVNCSLSEAFPMTLIEAFACDCKVVSYDIKYGPNELLTGQLSRFLAINRNLDSLIDVMKNALNNYPSGLDRIAKKYDIHEIMQEYYRCYNVNVRGTV